MVDAIINKLCELGDKYKAEGRDNDRRIAQECQKIVSQCFFEAEASASAFLRPRPKHNG